MIRKKGKSRLKHFFLFLLFGSYITIFCDKAQQTLNSMSLEEKIGQLFMVAAVSSPELNRIFCLKSPYTMDQAYIESLITNYHIGGIIFLGRGTCKQQRELTQHFQTLSKIPLLIGQDLEHGLAMRLNDGTCFPRAMTLGAITDNNIIYQIGYEIGRQALQLGVHINFAPVVDVNTNYLNPIINERAFSDDPRVVSDKATAFMCGLQDAGLLTCAKHFPGHGDTSVDSHTELPIIMHDQKRLQTVELEPFKALIAAQVDAIMIGHLAVPTLTKTNEPASLSRKIVTNLLKEKMNFNGLIITDGLGMRALSHSAPGGELELQALLAGNDILLCPLNVPKAVNLIKKAIKEGTLPEEELNAHVLKILRAKNSISSRNHSISPPITFVNAHALKSYAYEKAITVLDTKKIVPVNNANNINLWLQDPTNTSFSDELNRYAVITKLDTLSKKPSNDNVCILVLNQVTKLASKNFGLSAELIEQIQELCKQTRVVIMICGSPYVASLFVENASLVITYEKEPEAQQAAARIICGIAKPEGKLPITLPHNSLFNVYK